MGDVIDLKPAHLEDDELVENLARFADGTLSEAAVKARHHLSNEDWAALGESDKLVELSRLANFADYAAAPPNVSTPRSRSSMRRRYSAGLCVTPTPTHVMLLIQSRRSTRWPALAPKPRQPGARFEITINLGADHIEHYSKSIAIDANDTDPNHVDTTDVIAAITRNKSKGGGDGEGHI